MAIAFDKSDDPRNKRGSSPTRGFTYEYSEINVIKAHNKFPILLAGKKSAIVILWTKTMTSVGELKGSKHTFHEIIINNNGDKVVGIDSQGDVFIWRFNLLTMTPNTPPTSTIEGMHIKDACFINDSSFLVAVTQNDMYMFDLTKNKSNMQIWDTKSDRGDWGGDKI